MARRVRSSPEPDPAQAVDAAHLERIARQVANKLRAAGLGLDSGGQALLAERFEAALAQAESIADPGARIDFLLAFADEIAPGMTPEARRWTLPDTAYWREALGRPAP